MSTNIIHSSWASIKICFTKT